MKDSIRFFSLILFILAVGQVGFSQYFGKNKPRYETFDFKVVESPHFEIYHYLKDQEKVQELVNDSEKWYHLHQSIFQDTLFGRNPVLFYNNHADFQQTNAISGSIGVGTGGVTEALKNRVIMPLAMSNEQTDHVLGHEMVHAFQYSMILQGDSTSLESLGNLPLWMVEGLAEYLSIGRIDPHTAMWMRDAVLNKDVPELKDLNSPKYFPYRWGQVFWAFVTGLKGDEVIKPLFGTTAKYGFEVACRQVLGMKSKELSDLWTETLKNHYGQYVSGKQERSYGKEIINRENSGLMNISPSLSPDGKYIIYFSEKDIFTLDLYLADAKTGKIIRKLTSTLRDGHLDDISFIESAGTWSPDGKEFAFVGVKKGRNVIVIKNVENGKTVSEIFPKNLPAFSNPKWSPDGRNILVTGLKNGQIDLYLLSTRSSKVDQLTDDPFAEMLPDWSADGASIVFSTDQQSFERGRTNGKLVFNLAVLELSSLGTRPLPVFSGANNLNPLYGRDGSIYFLSDRDGFRNLYKYEPWSGKLFQMTDFLTGVSGITTYAPAISIGGKDDRVLFTHFFNRSYAISSALPGEFLQKEIESQAINMEAAVLPQVNKRAPMFVDRALQNQDTFSGVKDTDVRKRPYQPKFKLDFATGGGGVGIGNNAIGSNTLLAGGVTLLFNDMLGDHQLITSLALNGEIFDAGGQAVYINRKNRIAWGAGFTHIPYPSASFPEYFRDVISTNAGDFPVIRQSYFVRRVFEDRLDLFAQYPFSVTQRIEAGVGYARYYTRIDSINRYFATDPGYNFIGNFIGEDRGKVRSDPGFGLYNINAAYVGDNSFSGVASPLKGYRYRVGIEYYFGGFEFYSPTADFRFYQRLSPVTLAFRLTHLGRYGRDANDMFPIFLGYPWFVRGYQETFINETGAANDLTLANLLGSKIALGGFEVRLPFTGPERLSLVRSNFFLSELALFLDGGMAWSDPAQFNGDVTDIFLENGQAVERVVYPEVRPVFSTGVSLRLNLFGAMVLEPYLSRPLQKETRWVFGMNIVPGW